MKITLLILFFVSNAFAAEPGLRKSTKSHQPAKALRVKSKVVGGKDSATRFDEEFEALQKKLAEEVDPSKRYDLYAKGMASLSEIREKGPRPESEEKALEMAMVLDTFDTFPPKKEFQAEECTKYVENAQTLLGAQGPGDTAEPGVERGLKVLRLVCGQ